MIYSIFLILVPFDTKVYISFKKTVKEKRKIHVLQCQPVFVIVSTFNGLSVFTVYFFFAFCNMTFDFLLVRLTGAGVPITTGLKRSCSEHARLREKILQALWGEDDFFHEPEGLPCLYEKNTNYLCLWLWELSRGMTSLLRYVCVVRLWPFYSAFSERNVLFANEIMSCLKA